MDARPFRLGTCLFTLVEPHPGQEREYHRWYERDHFYSGMLALPHVFAGRRWAAPKRLKRLPGALGQGSFLATYWIEEDHHDDFLAPAMEAVTRLSGEGRMFGGRDHVHTGFYALDGWEARPGSEVTPELALDHPFAGLVAVLGGGAPPARASVALRLTWTPLPMPGFDPGDDALHVLFLDPDPGHAWGEITGGLGDRRWAAAFVPTVPGTDTYVDEL